VVVVLHGLFGLAVWLEMRPPAPVQTVPAAADQALQVRLIPRSAAPPVNAPPPLPPTPALHRIATAPAREPLAKHAMTVSMPGAAPIPRSAPRLFDRNGQPLLPPSPASVATSAPDYVPRLPPGDAQVMHHDDPIKYRSTRFDQYFPSPHETLLGQTARGVLRSIHTGDSKSVGLPGGVHLKCKTLLGIPMPMCQDPPAAPPRKDGDERLSMAPAQPLAKGVHSPPPPSEAQCIAVYRDGKPLPWGCPVDTPSRAIDAECVARYRAGKSLAGRCDPATTARRAAQPDAGGY
jgi:hypothetical protein